MERRDAVKQRYLDVCKTQLNANANEDAELCPCCLDSCKPPSQMWISQNERMTTNSRNNRKMPPQAKDERRKTAMSTRNTRGQRVVPPELWTTNCQRPSIQEAKGSDLHHQMGTRCCSRSHQRCRQRCRSCHQKWNCHRRAGRRRQA